MAPGNVNLGKPRGPSPPTRSDRSAGPGAAAARPLTVWAAMVALETLLELGFVFCCLQ